MTTEVQYSPGFIADKDIEIDLGTMRTASMVLKNSGKAVSNIAWTFPDATSKSWAHFVAGNPAYAVHESIMVIVVFQAKIKSLPTDEYELIQPIPVTIEKTEAKEYLARFDEANIGMTGETSSEAMENLIFDVLDSFTLFLEEEKSLGPEPARELNVLKRYLIRSR
jgi:hypothetical protein